MNQNIEYRTFQDMALCIRKNMHKLQENFDLIVGIPRSGMIPAYMIALFKNIKACSIDEFITNSSVSSGLSRNARTVNKITNVLIVDDSLHSGVSLAHTKERLKSAKLLDKYNIKFLAIYARERSSNLVDYWFEIVPTPRMFEWNYLNINLNERSCFDIDGVLCVDPTPEQNDDGEKYRNFLLTARPLYIPEYTIHTLVTSRLEKYRTETETWLKNNNVKYKNLVMLNLATKEERIKMGAHSKFKASIYASLSDTILFVESEPKQAEEIANLSGKPCICVENNKLYKPNENNSLAVININDYQGIRTKKVLLYSHELTYTGAPHSLLRICKVILKQGHFVEVWSPIDGEFKKEFENIGVRVRIIPYALFSNASVINAISHFDLALVNTAIPYKAYMVLKDYLPVIWYIREATNLPDICKGVPERANALKSAKELYCVSEYARDFIIKNYNKNVKVIHNCIEDFGEAKSNEVDSVVKFVTLGTVTHRKAFDIYINAFENLPLSYQMKAHLYFAGRLIKERSDYWLPLLEQAEMNPNISYVGEITDIGEKVSFMQEMNVVVVPSRDESCSLVVLEGASMAKPLIVTENVGAKYMVNDKNGLVIKTDSVEALTNAFKWFIDNKDRIPQMSIASRKSFEEQATIALYEKNIGEMIASHLTISATLYRKKAQLKKYWSSSLIFKAFKCLKHYGLIVTWEKIKYRLGLRKKPVSQITISTLGSGFVKRAADLADFAKIKGKVSGISFLTPCCLPVKKFKPIIGNDFGSQMVNMDCQKTMFSELATTKAEYLLIDCLDERYSVCKLIIKDKEYIVTKSVQLGNNYQRINTEASIKPFSFSKEKEIAMLTKFCAEILSIYDAKNIILIKALFPNTYVNENGKKTSFSAQTLRIIKNNNERIINTYNILKNTFVGCRIIDMTKYCVVERKSDTVLSYSSFGHEFYKHLSKKINDLLVR